MRAAALQDLLKERPATLPIEKMTTMDALHLLGSAYGKEKVRSADFPAAFDLTLSC